MRVCGIDPGKTGALAFLSSDPVTLLSVVPMPVTSAAGRRTQRTRNTLNWWAVAEALREGQPDLVVIERQGARPGQGVSSTFSIGFQYGGLLGILSALGLPFEIVEARTWKHALGLKGLDKNASRHRACELLPAGAAFFARQLDHGRAEACLIALWKIAYEQPRR